jgi:hypothetical protein
LTMETLNDKGHLLGNPSPQLRYIFVIDIKPCIKQSGVI